MVVALGALLACGACRTTGAPSSDPAARERMLAMLMPSSVEIVSPFTRIAPTSEDEGEGELDLQLELLLRASNALDNPGLMIVGDVRVELFEFRPASGEPKGRQLARWVVPLVEEEDQRTYWNPVTQMYEFRLGLRRESVPAQDQYVVLVTYNSPLGSHLSDEEVIDVTRFRRVLAPSARR
ncbi:MAG: hypothetical protein C4547_15020 [Phycisphaerales bacterium]|nr:MAG: hypothetical protein C4547_15020 [Phycisphaerales bacterium]